MNVRTPKVRQKATGAYVARWGGKEHYLSRDAAQARKLFSDPASTHPGSLAAWRAWAARRKAENSPGGLGSGASTRRLQLVDAAEMLFAAYLDADRADARGYFKTGLARFLRVHGEAGLVELATPAPARGRYNAPVVGFLEAFKGDLARRKKPRLMNKTINHDLTAVQRLFNFAAERGLCPAVNWTGVKKLPTRRGDPEVWSPERIGAAIEEAGLVRPELVPYLALMYLTVTRTSEVPRLARQQGRFEAVYTSAGKLAEAEGLFELAEHKNSWRGDPSYARHIILSDEALAWLRVARSAPVWGRMDSFAKAAVGAGFAPGPHILRDSAATHLVERGMPLEGVRLVLGHVPTGEWRSYVRVPWHDLRKKLARITLRSVLAPPREWSARIDKARAEKDRQESLARAERLAQRRAQGTRRRPAAGRRLPPKAG